MEDDRFSPFETHLDRDRALAILRRATAGADDGELFLERRRFESLGWDDGRLVLRAESDAMIVSGLIALLGQLYNGATREEILGFDAKAFLDEIGVSGALSSQRTNGLASMIARIQADAKALPAS